MGGPSKKVVQVADLVKDQYYNLEATVEVDGGESDAPLSLNS